MDGLTVQEAMAHSRHSDYATHIGYVQGAKEMKDTATAKMNRKAAEKKNVSAADIRAQIVELQMQLEEVAH